MSPMSVGVGGQTVCWPVLFCTTLVAIELMSPISIGVGNWTVCWSVSFRTTQLNDLNDKSDCPFGDWIMC